MPKYYSYLLASIHLSFSIFTCIYIYIYIYMYTYVYIRFCVGLCVYKGVTTEEFAACRLDEFLQPNPGLRSFLFWAHLLAKACRPGEKPRTTIVFSAFSSSASEMCCRGWGCWRRQRWLAGITKEVLARKASSAIALCTTKELISSPLYIVCVCSAEFLLVKGSRAGSGTR